MIIIYSLKREDNHELYIIFNVLYDVFKNYGLVGLDLKTLLS